MQSAPEGVPLSVRILRTGLGLLGAVAPDVAGRAATDLFTQSRSKRRGNIAARGAKALAMQGLVKQAHVWGEGGPTALLIHGWGSDSTSLFDLAGFLARNGLRAIAFDAPAHGSSPEARSTLSEFSRALEEVLDALSPVDAVVCHSLSGLALLGALSGSEGRKPGRVVLLSAPSCMTEVVGDFSRYMRLSPRVTASLCTELQRRNGVPVEYWDVAQLGRGLHLPILVIHDREDPFIAFSHAEALHAALPGSRLEPTEGLGHRRILKDQDVHRRILAFIHPSA